MPIVIALVSIILLSDFEYAISETISQPILVHALFRHGDRTPDGSILYPNDPYINETYYPYGLGQLTKVGKKTEFNLGAFLRNRYKHLVQDKFAPNVVYGRSTDMDRTKMSLQLVLAGLFPPSSSNAESWDSDVDWQPIAYDSSPALADELFYGNTNPLWDIGYVAHIVNLTMSGYFDPYQNVFQYLSENSGWPFSSFLYAFSLYFTFVAQEEWGLELPQWTKQVYPQILTDMVKQEYSFMVGTESLKTLLSGALLRKIVEDTTSKINDTLVPKERAIFLYSAHEINVATTLLTLGIPLVEVPSYGACVLFEVHQRGGNYGIEVHYKKGKENNTIPLVIPGCREVFCPLDDFISIVEHYFP